MALGSIFLFLALLVLVALFVARPLIADVGEERPLDNENSHWLAERERVLDALAELDADWQLGKVPEDIYKIQREQLFSKGAQALAQLDKLNPPGRTGETKKNKTESDDLEKMITAYGAKRKGRK